MQVLIADEDENELHRMAHALEEAGYEVLATTNAITAFQLIQQTSCRMLVCNQSLPEVSGLELCRDLRSAPLSGSLYFILLTDHNTSQDKVIGLAAGADDNIAKPIHLTRLVARVQIGERILSLESRDVTIFALARLAESRDPDTGAHLERVQAYSRLLAQQLVTRPAFQNNIDAEFIRLIFLTSPLHDIGKVGVPDSVLLKQGALTPDEFEIMKAHTLIGAETLQDALERFPGARYLEMARDIAATHHEHYDGKGYPRGLRGDEIPLCGRIVAVADAYDALTSKRVYKARMSHSSAKQRIVAASGTQFDPEVVAAFLRRQEDFMAVSKRFLEHDQPHRRGKPISAWGQLAPLPQATFPTCASAPT